MLREEMPEELSITGKLIHQVFEFTKIFISESEAKQLIQSLHQELEKVELTPEEQNKIIDNTLKEHYRETMERKRVPTDYLLMFTEGGESNAVACDIAQAMKKKLLAHCPI